jgi:hypothetical protein
MKRCAELNETVVEIAKQVEQILTAVFNINKRLKGRGYDHGAGAVGYQSADGGLVYRGFVTGNGFRRLGIRCAICRRLKNGWRKWPSIRTATARRC